jgi:hypothetical protein
VQFLATFSIFFSFLQKDIGLDPEQVEGKNGICLTLKILFSLSKFAADSQGKRTARPS